MESRYSDLRFRVAISDADTPSLSFLSLFVFWKKPRKTTKKERILYPYRTPEIPGKEGKNAKKRNSSQGEKKQGISKKQGKEGQGSFCRISGDLAPSTRKSLAIAIVRFWSAKAFLNLAELDQTQESVNCEVQTMSWEAGKEGAVETGVKRGLRKAHKPRIEGKNSAQTVNFREGLNREVQTVNWALWASKIRVFQFRMCTSWFAPPWQTQACVKKDAVLTNNGLAMRIKPPPPQVKLRGLTAASVEFPWISLKSP